jgi:carbamoyl-phosphate synthase small subunit
MTDRTTPSGAAPTRATGVLVLADGTVFRGVGLGAEDKAVGEVCFNTAMSGYQEILTDPSYAGQIVSFTFPHIGNVGTNDDDAETGSPAVRGAVFRAKVTGPSNYRATATLSDWLKARNIVALAGLDTRALTARIRSRGMPDGIIAHNPAGEFDIEALRAEAAGWGGLEGRDLAKDVTTRQTYEWAEAGWNWDTGAFQPLETPKFHVVALDFGIKRAILRCLGDIGAKVTVVPADTPADEILARDPDGIFLSNGPGDPAATGEYAVPAVKKLVDSGKPVFGICLGHQILGLSLGGRTVKMHQGHHGANHPVKDLETGKVEITSMNHGFAVDALSLPEAARETHRSLFDGSNCGLRLEDRPVFSVQYHPEASPGPVDSHYLFARFAAAMAETQGG